MPDPDRPSAHAHAGLVGKAAGSTHGRMPGRTVTLARVPSCGGPAVCSTPCPRAMPSHATPSERSRERPVLLEWSLCCQ